MRIFLKLTVRAVSCRLYSGGRPPAPLGGRILTHPEDIFQHNMWDHVQWTEEEREKARQKAEENSKEKIPLEEQSKYDREAHKYWDRFYETHQSKFFRNRNWLFTEFPELLPPDTAGTYIPEQGQSSGLDSCSESENREKHQPYGSSTLTSDVDTFPGQHAAFRILEVGCGAGNSVFPIISSIRGSKAFLYCCDFSSRAVELIQEHPDYDPAVCHAFVRDICDTTSPFPFPPESLDIILVVFVLSAIHPARRAQGVVESLAGHLKQGGIVLFRDYGRYDLSQLRFKKGQCLSENFYTRQDGTCVYFFTKDEVHHLFSNAGLEEIQNLEDRRLQVNRGKKVVMHRVWMQSKYRKPYLISASV
ncbi:mRNA N(3)-methylcytidine methyltransferase METTL8 isoform X1 [Megalobrama amblycephala]|uniref:mRNA N(3)-methylcytidine methyltransferase METTL8 isoform X1 n=1 Tax=Megalobrama amblycephala TaxID=75352 RepID=UPI002014035F|nr:mRNA N(3)-methylcytidine methyltransferase METTL8 isoform X1 [Megalobrama amblycephala]XP_048048742.1 mRNA N(3)-methylcytidine methyltransferase METTL8 isoform X1 [Megalobrama amblycephala]